MTISYELEKTIKLETQPEGCAADDDLSWVYIGEEDRAIWKFPAEPDEVSPGIIIDEVGSIGIPEDDIEGITIYKTGKETGFLIVSSQGNSTYAVYDINNGNDYLGSFSIDTGKIDRVSETDGIEAVQGNFGKNFPKGLFIVQDDKNEGFTTNFKIVSWSDIEKGLKKIEKGSD